VPHLQAGALNALGWDDRTLALFDDVNASVGPGLTPARAVRAERSACAVVSTDGDERYVTATVLPAVGDWLALRDGDVAAILPRWSALTRTGPGGEAQVLATNVDLVLITVPADRPNAARAERELVLAWQSGAQPLVVLTKADLPASVTTVRDMEERLVGTEVLAASATTGLGLAELRARLAPNRTAVLIGPSGAGKSTLVNSLVGRHAQATGEVRGTDSRGRHTTASRQLLTLPGGGVLIDTPGLRSLGLPAGGGLAAAFGDIQQLADQCRFSDCRHESEPGCAVGLALSSGQLGPLRLANYRKLQGELREEERRQGPAARKVDQMVRKQRPKWARASDKRKQR
jgi:ribosome biogenesis GTPase